MEVAGQMVQGGQNIFLCPAGGFMSMQCIQRRCDQIFSGEFIFMIFGFRCNACNVPLCKAGKRKSGRWIVAFRSIGLYATGITEPPEFSFLFVAPALFAVQVVLAGSAYMISAYMLNIAVGLTFSGGFWISSCLVFCRNEDKLDAGDSGGYLLYFVLCDFTFLIKI